MDILCRTCLCSTSEMTSIQHKTKLDGQNIRISYIISACTGLEVSKYDQLGFMICENCLDDLKHYYKFRQKCWQSNKFLIEQTVTILKPKVIVKNLNTDKRNLTVIKQSENAENIFKTEILDEFILSDEEYVSIDEVMDVSNYDIETSEDHFSIKKEQKSVNDDIGTDVKCPHKCYLCGQMFQNIYSLKVHFRTIHNRMFDKKFLTYKCEDCEQNFEKYTQYRTHLKSHASSTLVCDYCGLSLKNKQNFTEHVRRHTGEKPYECNLCGFRTAQKTGIKIHQRSHTGERPYECHVCHKMFRTASARASHRRTHYDETPYECLVCGKKFKKREIYKEHLIIHDVEKHTSCEYCGKKFARKDNLATHIKQHTGEKPHACDVCGKRFIQKHCWRTHMKNHHGK